jgi:hypothetical protein
MRTRHVVLSLLIALACTAPLGAQSFLGGFEARSSIRRAVPSKARRS